MKFNFNLIDPALDEEIYGDVCPTLGTLMLARYSTPTKHNPVIYRADNEFFDAFPDRTMYLRLAYLGEFDVLKGSMDSAEPPTLWVLVHKLSVGVHERTPRWRGTNFWKVHGTDEEIALLMVEIAERGALSLSEWYGYVSDKRVSNLEAKKAADRNARKKAN
jgi:hypothetical protein